MIRASGRQSLISYTAPPSGVDCVLLKIFCQRLKNWKCQSCEQIWQIIIYIYGTVLMSTGKFPGYILFQRVHLLFIMAYLLLCTESSDESTPMRKHQPCPHLPILQKLIMNQILTMPKGGLERKLEGSLLVGTLLFCLKELVWIKVRPWFQLFSQVKIKQRL